MLVFRGFYRLLLHGVVFHVFLSVAHPILFFLSSMVLVTYGCWSWCMFHCVLVCLSMCIIRSLWIHEEVVGCASAECVFALLVCWFLCTSVGFGFCACAERRIHSGGVFPVLMFVTFCVCSAYVRVLLTSVFRRIICILVLICLLVSIFVLRTCHLFRAFLIRVMIFLRPLSWAFRIPPRESPWFLNSISPKGSVMTLRSLFACFCRVIISTSPQCIPSSLEFVTYW